MRNAKGWREIKNIIQGNGESLGLIKMYVWKNPKGKTHKQEKEYQALLKARRNEKILVQPYQEKCEA